MARKLRVEYPGGIYHVMNRGDRREAVVHDDADRKPFVATLAESCARPCRRHPIPPLKRWAIFARPCWDVAAARQSAAGVSPSPAGPPAPSPPIHRWVTRANESQVPSGTKEPLPLVPVLPFPEAVPTHG
jgi:hypothetical protein